jgi:NAD(P)-dependent dehydrogenase (short-subunit alcohol dehydrogenase family)
MGTGGSNAHLTTQEDTSMRLENKVAIVTGAGRGIGRGIARLFAREAAKVVLAARTEKQICDVRQEITAAGGTAAAIVTDVASIGDIERMVRSAVEQFGRLDILVNNAGVGWPGYAIDDDRMVEAYDRLMATNLRSAWMGAHYAVPHMKRAGGGAIINISSVHAWASCGAYSVYAASKGGMVAGSRALALELAPFMIRVNVISPGAIQVDEAAEPIAREYGEQRRVEFLERFGDFLNERYKYYQDLHITGLPEDIAHCAVYLASDESRFVTGTNITVDGGLTARLTLGADISPELQRKEQEMREWLAGLKPSTQEK